MDRIPGYILESVLGTGSLGIVYRAREEIGGDVVALKVLQSPEASHRASFRREVRVLERIQHPGVARVFRHDVNATTPWCALEMVEGPSLETLIQGSAESLGSRSRVQAMLRIAHDLCAPLSAVHGEGIVHRDLKPSNVVVAGARGPVLVDFDLASRFSANSGRERIDAGGTMTGTIAYMSPEQIRGDLVDARADLYALGCVLYEMVTGATPFLGRPWEIVEQHLAARAKPVRNTNTSIPPSLDALIGALLEKEPRNRPGYADEVAASLREVVEPAPQLPAAPGRTYLYRPSFVGRDESLGQIEAAVTNARQGQGCCMVLVGESGVGKTRLAMQAATYAARMGMTVVTAECVAPESDRNRVRGGPLHPMRPLLQHLADVWQSSGRSVPELVMNRIQTLAAFEPALAVFDSARPSATSGGRVTQDRVIADLAEVVRDFATDHPLVLVVDDLQWADPLTLDFLAALPEDFFATLPVCLLLTCRAEETPAILVDLCAKAHIRRFDVGRLSEGEVSDVVGGMLGLRSPPPALARFIGESSEGNPFFAAEQLRGVIDAGLLARSSGGKWILSPTVAAAGSEHRSYDSLPIPSSLGELVLRRLDRLSDDALRVVEVASVIGREFALAEAADLAAMPEDRAYEALLELVACQIVSDTARGEMRFVHDKFREGAYSRIVTSDRERLHLRAAHLLEARAVGDRRQLLPVLGHHWAAAGRVAKAIVCFDEAAAHMIAAGAFRDASQLLYRATELTHSAHDGEDSRLRRVQRERRLSVAASGLGDIGASVRHALDALGAAGRRAPSSLPGWTASLVVETLRLASRRRPRRSPPDPVMTESARAAGHAATGFYFAFELLPAIVTSLRCINDADHAGQAEIGALASAQLGSVLGALRLHGPARALFRRAARHGTQGEDASLYGAAQYFLAIYETGRGNWGESIAAGENSYEVLSSHGDEQEAEIAATVVANAHHLAGRHLDALKWSRRLLESARRRWNAQHTGWGQFLTGRALLALGEPAEAQRFLEQGHELLERLPDTVSTMMCEGLLADVLVRAGEDGPAVAMCEQLQTRVTSTRGLSPLVPLVQCVDGYGSLAEVYLTLSERGSDVLAREELHRRVRSACRDLRMFAVMFPGTRTRADRCRARMLALDGAGARASILLQLCIDRAGRSGMHYDAALSHLALGCLGGEPPDGPNHREASALLHRLGMDASAIVAAHRTRPVVRRG